MQHKTTPTIRALVGSLLLLFGTYTVQAQHFALAGKSAPAFYHDRQQESGSLQTLLQKLEQDYEVQFAYDSELINGKKVTIKYAKEQGLENVLTKALKLHKLQYKKIGDKLYVIQRKETEDLRKLDTSPKNKRQAPERLSSIGNAQLHLRTLQQTISGKVTDGESGDALPGVNVLAKGTTSGTVTDIEGNYRLTVADEVNTLVFSSIGYVTQEVEINNRTAINLTLAPDIQSLSEVVVIGYGTQRKSDLTGSVGSVQAEELAERPTTSVPQALAGRVAGVDVAVNSGRPGGSPNIRIRGSSSVSNTNSPLYVVDGVILEVGSLQRGTSPIEFIEPSSIESIEVLKDASATAIYGARGANGVILITTKRGSQDGGRVTYDGYTSVGVLPKKVDVLNSEEFLMVEEIAYQNAEKFDPEGWAADKYTDPKLKRTDPLLFDENGNPLYDTDWQEEATQKAWAQSHQLSFSGGDAKNSYGLFMGYRNEDGVLRESWLKRYSGRFVLDSKINDWLTAGGSLSYNFQNEKQLESWSMRMLYESLPIIPVRYPDGTWAGNEDYPGMEGGPNLIRFMKEDIHRLETQTLLGNVFTNIRLAEGLELRTTFGTNIITQQNKRYSGRDLPYRSRNQQGIASVTNDRRDNWQFENYLTYNTNFTDAHALTFLLGLSWQQSERFFSTAASQGFVDDFFQYNNLGVGSNPQAPGSGSNGYSLNSYFARVNYNLLEKYLFTLTGRIDGSSKFGVENRYAFFPSAALGWRVSEENFLNNNPVISNLKLRTSVGMTGNSEIPTYQGLAGLGNYSVIFGGQRAIGVGVDRLANPDLRWEKNTQVDAGVELGLFDDRIYLEMDVYRRVSNDMLLNAPVPSTSGYTSVTRNVGSMENRGVELALTTYNISTDNVTWSTNFNISINKNKVLKLTGGADIFPGSATIVREGEAVNSFFGYVHLGTWNTDEADEAAQYNRLPGDIKYLDVNEDGSINQADRLVIGNGMPDGYGSFINTLRYKRLELMVDLQFMYGNDIMWQARHSTEDRQGIANSLGSVLNAWTPENQNTPIAQFRPVSAGYDTNDDSHRLEDGSFLRGRNLLLSYNLAPELTERVGLRNVRVYTSIQNFFLVTGYPSYDPEVSTSGGQFAQGYAQYFEYPKPRVFMLGVNIGL
uniref:SusC/RagA family TonB-linked outer membrane protein n=1 Tax=Roseihalotalea indica TaxID=2867963 RepID=A0AA49GJL8_9BACT|nr:SusC/RagA family TonB-linked outer membrane protein [Tunicatimonas sp. TK19036]